MSVADLGAVLAIENSAYEFPWTRGNFIDSLAAGYWTEVEFDIHGHLDAYAVAMPVVDEMHLLNLTVAPLRQGAGHGQAMLDRLAAQARFDGLHTLWLEVRQSNTRAHRLYEWLGFREVGRRPGYYPAANGRREDAIVMRLALPQEFDHGLV
jgi:ribosomal-protein-alanine N-acetyltransferase